MDLFPANKINENIHRFICKELIPENIFDTKSNTKATLFLDRCEQNEKGSIVIRTFEESDLRNYTKLAVKNPKQFQLAGIDAFWNHTSDGKTEVRFYVNLNKAAFEDGGLMKKLGQLTQNHVALIMKHFVNVKPSLQEIFDFETGKSSDVRNMGRFLNEMESSTKNWKPSKVYDLPNCQLMDFQKKTVQWMMKQEEEPDFENLKRFAKCVKLRPPRGTKYPRQLYYFPNFGLFSESQSIFHNFYAKGGILADESGLGKTVQVISLILSNPKDEICQLPGKKRKVGKSGKCAICQGLCDLEEVGWKDEFDEKDARFQCVKCIATQPRREVKTTLIAAPESLIPYWLEEISKNNLKVKIYTGLDVDGYLNSLEIADLDVILVSYDVLKAEFWHTSTEVLGIPETQKISMTSLSHVKWWRFVCDEAQLINQPLCQASVMCQTHIHSQVRWCVTGTPIEHDISELFGLLKLIHFWPFNIENLWKMVVMGFEKFCREKKDLSTNLLVQFTSQIFRRTLKNTVIDEIGLLKVVEIEKVVELSPIEDVWYKKEMEDVKQEVKKVIGNVSNDAMMCSLDENEKVFEIIDNLKETLITGGEHDDGKKLKRIREEVISDPKNCLIPQMKSKKMEINDILPSTIENLLKVAEITCLDGPSLAAKNYADVAEVFELVNEINQQTDQMKSVEIIDLTEDEDDVRTQKSNRKRGPTKDGGKPSKIGRFEANENRVEKEAKADIEKLKRIVTSPISIDVNLTSRFVLNMLEVYRSLGDHQVLDNAIDKMGGKDKLIANLCSMIERFSKEERDGFQDVKKEYEELTELWEKNKDKHSGMTTTLEKIGEFSVASSKELATKLVQSPRTRTIMKGMSIWPVFKDAKKHIMDGQVGSTTTHERQKCYGICNNSSFKIISENYELSTTEEMLQHLINYINGLENLREELMTSYTTMVSSFQAKYLDTTNAIHEKCHTVLCSYHKSFDDISDARNKNVQCQICSTRFSLACLSFELGVGSYHGDEKEVRGKLPIQKFLEKFLAEVQRLLPNFDVWTQFVNFVEYIEHIRRTVDDIRSGCDDIQKYKESLRKLYLMQKPIDLDELRRLDKEKKHKTDEDLKKAYLKDFAETSKCKLTILKNSCGDFRFLISLYKNEGSSQKKDNEENCCPTCMDDWTNLNGFVGLPCGHRICQNCYPHLRNQQYTYMKCSNCRKQFEHADVFVGRENANQKLEQDLIPGMSLSSKLMETIKLLREIVAKGVDENVVLFTTSEVGSMMWKYLINVFEKAELPFAQGTQAPRGSAFRFSDTCRILICSHEMDQIGHDLTNANHLIFLDPTDSHWALEKAVNRVIRIGQKREVTVYHMSVKSSIDDDIRRMCNAGKTEAWTAGDIRQIFNIKFEEAVPRLAVMRAVNRMEREVLEMEMRLRELVRDVRNLREV